MKVEMLETVRWEGIEYGDQEIRNVTDALGSFFCANGWAKDVAGVVETKERSIYPRTLQIQSVVNGGTVTTG